VQTALKHPPRALNSSYKYDLHVEDNHVVKLLV
jgi:hypothetical protein